jgi:hypothetical protein
MVKGGFQIDQAHSACVVALVTHCDTNQSAALLDQYVRVLD